MFSVRWSGGEEVGFGSRETANRFIKAICMKVAPGLNYSVLLIGTKEAYYKH